MSKRERIEDLGVLSEKLSNLIAHVNDLKSYVLSIKPTALIDDLIEVEWKINEINLDLGHCWDLARFGEDSEE